MKLSEMLYVFKAKDIPQLEPCLPRIRELWVHPAAQNGAGGAGF